MASLTDNTLLTATDLGVMDGEFTINDTFTNVDRIDYFKFTLAENADLAMAFSGTSSLSRFTLIADLNNNGIIDSGETLNVGSGLNVTRFEPLPAGTYFFEIRNTLQSSPQSYSLRVVETRKPGNIPTDPGDTLATAFNLGTLSGQSTLRDYVGDLDALDVYRFTLTQRSNLAIVIASATDGLPVSVIADLNNNGIRDNGERIRGVVGNQTSVNLEAGTYFLEVGSSFASAITNYQLNLNQVPDFSGDDRRVGTAAADVLRGFAGNDTLLGQGGNDRLFGDEGRDRLLGGAGNDTLLGGTGNDVLLGEAGNDVLNGGSGNDWLEGGLGNDVLITGAGLDRIVLRRGQGLDRVIDFRNNFDKIDLVGLQFGQLTLRQQQNDTLIRLGQTTLMVLEDTRVGQITRADFV